MLSGARRLLIFCHKSWLGWGCLRRSPGSLGPRVPEQVWSYWSRGSGNEIFQQKPALVLLVCKI